jgi:integrase
MASISNDPGGLRRLLFLGPDGKRKAVRLGDVTKREAEEIKLRVERIVAAANANLSVDGETARWLAGLGRQLHARLAKAGLVAPRQAAAAPEVVTLGAWLGRYIAGRTDVKPSTSSNLDKARAALVAYFGADKPLCAITAGDADAWAVWLRGKYTGSTPGRMVRWAKQFFRAALRHKLAAENPFADTQAPGGVDRSRQFFVTREAAARVLEACPGGRWRLVFALARYGGLRVPSEVIELRWAEVDWERGRFLVHAPKTERHEGKAERWVPLFPELRPHLEEAFERAEPGAVKVAAGFSRRSPAAALKKIIRRAGLTPWPKLFQNLRSSRETELAAEYPMHVVCAWIGNSPRIAMQHYLQVTEDDFTRAAQKAAQQAAAPGRSGAKTGVGDSSPTPVLRPETVPCEPVRAAPLLNAGTGTPSS